jgi:hypothetical protein
MSRIIRRRPSPSMLVAGTALAFALAGTAIAGPFAMKSVLSKGEKKQVKSIARNQVKSLAPGLSVANATNATNATNASNVDGASASDLKTSSAFNQNNDVIPIPGGMDTIVASATITTQSAGRILASGSAELLGADTDERGQCQIRIDGTDSINYESAADDVGAENEFVIAVNFAVERPAGTYTANLECRASAGTISKEDAAISVYALGT